MADNVTLPGAAEVVATDEVAVNGGTTGHVQFNKLVDGRSNGTDGIPGDTQGLWTVARRDLQRIAVASAGLTIATTAYTAGDQVGTLFTLANAARATGGTGTIVGASLIDVSDRIGAYDIVIFRNSVTLAADNAAFTLSTAAHRREQVAVIQLAGAFDLGAHRAAQAFNLAIPYDTGSDANLYAALITRVGHSFFTAVDDLQLTVHVERN